jgi:DNA-binding CsgD family transcriptional regulator
MAQTTHEEKAARALEPEISTVPFACAPVGAHDKPTLLLVRNEPPNLRLCPINGQVDLGRNPTKAKGDAIPLDGEGVADHHARIVRIRQNEYELVDLGSGAPPFADRHQLTPGERMRLVDGVSIFIGGHILVFRFLCAGDLRAFKDEEAAPLGPVPTLSRRLGRTTSRLRSNAMKGDRPLERGREPILFDGDWGAGVEGYARAFHDLCGDGGQFRVVDCQQPAAVQDVELASLWAEDTAASRPSRDATTIYLNNVDLLNSDWQARLVGILRRLRSDVTGVHAPGPRLLAAMSYDATTVPETELTRAFSCRLRVPGLAKRKEDIPALCARALGEAKVRALHREALRILMLRPWRWNLPELEAVLSEAAARADAEGTAEIHVRHLPPDGRFGMRVGGSVTAALDAAVDVLAAKVGLTEREVEVVRLSVQGGRSRKEVAGILGVSERAVGYCWEATFQKTRRSSPLEVFALLIDLVDRSMSTLEKPATASEQI